MFRYSMTFNDEAMTAYFSDHFEASAFLDECDHFGDTVIVHGYEEVTADDIKNDDTISYAEMVEYLAILLLPNYKEFPKWTYQEAELQRLGYLA